MATSVQTRGTGYRFRNRRYQASPNPKHKLARLTSGSERSALTRAPDAQVIHTHNSHESRFPAEGRSSGRELVAQSDMTVASILPRKSMTATATTISMMPMISINGSCWSRVVSLP